MQAVILKPKKQHTDITVTENTQFILDPDSKLAEIEINLIFENEGVNAELMCPYVLENSEKKLTTVATHKTPNTVCDTKIRGVLLDNSKSDYIGKIIIEKEAQQTNSYLDDSVIVAGKGTKNNSQPILEIEADDVKASHGATTGRLSTEMVYYLQSRGLSEKEAKSMVLEGFFEALISRIKDEKIMEEIREKLLKKLP